MTTKLANRTGAIALVVLSLGLAATLIVFVLLPGRRAIARVDAFGGAIDMLASTEASLVSLDDEVDWLERELIEAESLLPDGVGVDEFVERLGAAAGTAGVRVESVVPGTVADRPRYRKLSLELRAAGDYPSLHRFLGAVEDLPQLTRVESVKISGNEKTCTAQVGLALYYARSEKEG